MSKTPGYLYTGITGHQKLTITPSCSSNSRHCSVTSGRKSEETGNFATNIKKLATMEENIHFLLKPTCQSPCNQAFRLSAVSPVSLTYEYIIL